MSSYSVAYAKEQLSKLIDEALAGESVVITRHGKPVVELRPSAGTALAGADPADHLVVGTVDEVVVGYGWSRLETLHDGTSLLVVSDLYVDPEARAIGVGEAMMDQLVAHARAAGAIGIDAIALPGDRHTKNFFETFGLTARAIVVHRSLLEPSEESG